MFKIKAMKICFDEHDYIKILNNLFSYYMFFNFVFVPVGSVESLEDVYSIIKFIYCILYYRL